jgi:hypothetical protein
VSGALRLLSTRLTREGTGMRQTWLHHAAVLSAVVWALTVVRMVDGKPFLTIARDLYNNSTKYIRG